MVKTTTKRMSAFLGRCEKKLENVKKKPPKRTPKPRRILKSFVFFSNVFRRRFFFGFGPKMVVLGGSGISPKRSPKSNIFGKCRSKLLLFTALREITSADMVTFSLFSLLSFFSFFFTSGSILDGFWMDFSEKHEKRGFP